MSRFTGLQFTGLPCLPVFFFRATPSPQFTDGMPVYRGGSFFHARGAPPAAAHSHTRCCTQHNTTRWVLRAAANTCLHTMPCAAGELLPSMYSSIAHSYTNNTVVAGYHDSRRNTDTPYRSLWKYICSSCARAGVFPGIPACTGKQPVYRYIPVYRFTGLPCLPVLFGLATTGR